MLLVWIGGSLLAAEAVEVPPGPPTPIDPGSWVSRADYPAQAMAEGIAGDVGFKLDVDETGRPVKCEVTQSAHPILDEATCRILLEKARFRPAVGADGTPVPDSYRSRIEWRFPEDSDTGDFAFVPLVLVPSRAELVLSLPAGRNAHCRFEAIGPVPSFVASSPCPFVAWDPEQFFGPQAPVAGTLTVRMSVVPEGHAVARSPAGRGELVAAREWAFRFGEDKRLADCGMVRKDEGRGAGWFPPLPEVCDLLRIHHLVATDEGSGPTAGRIVWTVHLETPED